STQSGASDGEPSAVFADYLNTGGATALAKKGGNSSCTATLLHSTLMSATFSQSRMGNVGADTESQIVLWFSTDADLPYSASGSLTTSGGFTRFYFQLSDVDTEQLLFQSDQSSVGTPAAFVVGGMMGNNTHYFTGSLTGM